MDYSQLELSRMVSFACKERFNGFKGKIVLRPERQKVTGQFVVLFTF